MSEVIGILPWLANLSSCRLYIRGEDTNIRDWSPQKRTITVHGSVSQSATNAIFPKKSLLFDGTTGWLSAADSADLHPGSSDFAVHVGIYPTTAGTSDIIRLSANTASNEYAALGVGRSDATTLYVIYSTTGTSWDNIGSYSCTASLPTNSKRFVDVIRLNNTLTAYVNGSQVGQWTSLGSLYNGGVFGATIGYNTSSNPYYFVGSQDEIAFWHGAYGKVPTISQLYPQTRRFIT